MTSTVAEPAQARTVPTGATTPAPPSPGRTRGRLAIAATAVGVVLVLASVLLLGLSGAGGQPLGATSTQPSGAKAVVEVLRSQGVRVVTTSTLAATRKAVSRAGVDTTVFAYDQGDYLDRAQWQSLGSLGRHTVLAEPGPVALRALAPGVTQSSTPLDGTLSPRCDLPSLAEAQRITGSGSRYTTVTNQSGALVTRCLPAESGAGYGLVQLATATHDVTILGATESLTNGAVSDHDNAAMALALLGSQPTLVWYLPTIDDLPTGSGTLASLTPGWVTPSIALLAAATVAGAVWRGRRLGPLVVENLPVVVRSTETVEGRARLYQRSSSRTHAIDQVRIGTLARLSSVLGLGRSASVDDVVLRVAALLSSDPGPIRRTLVDDAVGDDRQLVSLSDSLRDLEAAVSHAIGVAGSQPPPPFSDPPSSEGAP